MSLGSVPVSVEYYIQERLGYDVHFTFIRNPFFERHRMIEPGEEYARGFSFALRQKFYQPEDNLGMFYYGHEVRVSPLSHFSNVLDGTSISPNPVQLDEVKLEYSVLFGNRLTSDASNKGWTMDIFVGLGVGVRFANPRFPVTDQSYNHYFKDIREKRLTVPVRLGVNFGYALNRLKR